MFTILHTNDFHNRLLPAQATRLEVLRRNLGNNGLLLDAGDAVAAGNITFRPGGEPILDAMTSIRYDAMTVGNREFHFSRHGFITKLSRAAFPILCANVRRARSYDPLLTGGLTPVSDPQSDPSLPALVSSHEARPDSRRYNRKISGNLPVKSQVCFVLAGTFKVLVFGLTVPMITERMTSRHVSAYVFDDPIKVGTSLAARLKAEYRPDLLIALTHIGIAGDRELAVAAPEIDLIIGGHTHVVLEHGERVGETLIVQAGSHGRYYGRIDIEPNVIVGGRPEMTAQLEPLC